MPHSKILCQTNLNDILVSMNPPITQTTLKPKENAFTEIIKFALLALVIVIPIRTFIAQPFVVSGPSMDPTFANRQYLIVDEISYRFQDPSREDVIVFKYPLNPKLHYIKRIIGLPNETVSIKSGKITIINDKNPEGIMLDDSYITDEYRTSETLEAKLGPTEYFVMGDNRKVSADSRIFGNLDKKYIVGRPFLRLLPLNKVSVFPGIQ